ncbi:MAG: hypothetical protein GTO18_15690 [Anaerolineales bacterium]|nr:hypothetical protein [Anaerolineales bacterium]
MNVGMLWYDGDAKKTMDVRIERASEYYQDKYGRVPNLCYIHPRMAGEDLPSEINGLKVLTSNTVLPDHFWLGVEDADEVKAHSKLAA